MKKIFIIYGHYDDKSFNASIKNTFIETAEENGHEVDCVDLYKEKFDPVFSGGEPGRRRTRSPQKNRQFRYYCIDCSNMEFQNASYSRRLDR